MRRRGGVVEALRQHHRSFICECRGLVAVRQPALNWLARPSWRAKSRLGLPPAVQLRESANQPLAAWEKMAPESILGRWIPCSK